MSQGKMYQDDKRSRTVKIVQGSIFDSPAHAIVNTVNTVGVMGKGIARTFKTLYPDMFFEYKKLCQDGRLKPGTLHLWKTNSKIIINFPTKTTWRKPSKLEYIELGLEKFVQSYKNMGIRSISFPPLGCGNGNLDWDTVRPIMIEKLDNLDIPVLIHDVKFESSFVPEHLVDKDPPSTIDDFVADILKAANKIEPLKTNKGENYRLEKAGSSEIRIVTASGHEQILDSGLIEQLWDLLRLDILIRDNLDSHEAKKLISLVFPALIKLSYVDSLHWRNAQDSAFRKQMLFFNQKGPIRSNEAAIEARNEPDLFRNH